MHKFLSLLTILVLSSNQLFSQCQEPVALAYLHGNDVKAIFRNAGDMFWDGTTAQYNVPYVQGQNPVNSIFAGALWVGGYDQGGNLSLAAQTYRSSGNDYWSGPLDQTGQPINCNSFDRIWKAPGAAVQALLADFNDNGSIDNPVDNTLLAWPAKGNPFSVSQNGFALPNQDLAPFFDQNNDGIYNPYDGDYPIADPDHPTVIADDLLWMVFNDNGNLHTQTTGYPLKIEVQLTAYAFNCPNDDLINRAIFTRHKIINKNPLSLHNVKAGLWTDFDLGCGQDDYMGSIPSMNTVYAYNQDNNDDLSCGGFGTGYGLNPPVQAHTFLNQTMTNSIYHINSPSDPKGDPSSALGYYRLLSGTWPNSVPLTTGGDGYNPSSSQTTTFAFPDNPNNQNGWSMVSQNLSGLDFRTVSTIDANTLAPGGSLDIVSTYSYHRDLDSNNLQNVNLMYQQIPILQNYYANGYTCPTILSKKSIQNASEVAFVKVYPNPAHNVLTIESEADALESVELLTLLGQSVRQVQNINSNATQLTINDLAKGIYILKIKSGEHVWSQKVEILD